MRSLLISALVLPLHLVAASHGTNHDSCVSCYKDGYVHCVDKTFQNGYCCTDRYSLEKCMNRYDFCTYHLDFSIYKVFTCPMQDSCPNGGQAKEIAHTKKMELVQKTISWSQPAKHCKMKISASHDLNGKIVFDFDTVNSATVYLFLQPNDYDHNHVLSIGHVENKKVVRYPKEGQPTQYEVPTDWSIYLTYITESSGSVSFSTWVEPLEQSDESKIASVWKPTGVSYADQEAERLRLEEEERIRQQEEEIAKQLEAERLKLEEEERLRKEEEARLEKERLEREELERKQQEELQRQIEEARRKEAEEAAAELKRLEEESARLQEELRLQEEQRQKEEEAQREKSEAERLAEEQRIRDLKAQQQEIEDQIAQMERERQEAEEEQRRRQMEGEIDVDDGFNALFEDTQNQMIAGGAFLVVGFILAICCIRACNKRGARHAGKNDNGAEAQARVESSPPTDEQAAPPMTVAIDLSAPSGDVVPPLDMNFEPQPALRPSVTPGGFSHREVKINEELGGVDIELSEVSIQMPAAQPQEENP